MAINCFISVPPRVILPKQVRNRSTVLREPVFQDTESHFDLGDLGAVSMGGHPTSRPAEVTRVVDSLDLDGVPAPKAEYAQHFGLLM